MTDDARRRRFRDSGPDGAGASHFLLQRVTSIAAMPLSFFLVATLIAPASADGPADALAGRPFVGALMLASLCALIVHMRIGVRNVVGDYVRTPVVKTALLLANFLFTWIVGAVCGLSILKLVFA